METKKLTMDEFSKFLAKEILSIEYYSFDMLYDIAKIVKLFNENRGQHEQPIFKELHLMVRNTGCDLVEPTDECYNTYESRSSIVYHLTFCWNCDYFLNIPFVEIKC